MGFEKPIWKRKWTWTCSELVNCALPNVILWFSETPLIDDFLPRVDISCMLKAKALVVQEERVLIVSLETSSRECPWVQALTSTFFSLMEYLTFWAGKGKKTRPSSDSLSPLKQVHSQTDRHKHLHHHVFLVLVNQLNLSTVKLVFCVASIHFTCSEENHPRVHQLIFLYSNHMILYHDTCCIKALNKISSFLRSCKIFDDVNYFQQRGIQRSHPLWAIQTHFNITQSHPSILYKVVEHN